MGSSVWCRGFRCWSSSGVLTWAGVGIAIPFYIAGTGIEHAGHKIKEHLHDHAANRRDKKESAFNQSKEHHHLHNFFRKHIKKSQDEVSNNNESKPKRNRS